MNLFFSDAFDTDTANALPAWFTDISGAWKVIADASAFTPPNDFQDTSAADGDKVLILGGAGVSIPATADMVLASVTKSYLNAFSSQGIQYIVRSDSTAQNYYVYLMTQATPSTNIGFQLYKSVGGSLTAIGGIKDTGFVWPGSGIALRVKIAAIGSTISAKVWQDGTSEPGSYQVNQTDTAVTAAGYAGFYNSGTHSGYAVDNVQVFGNSSLTAGTLSSSSVTNTTLTVTSTSPSGGASPYTYQWYRSTSSNFVPQTSNLRSGATSLSLNDTSLTPNTTYYYVLVATDNAGVIAWSSQLSVTTTGGALTSGAATLNSVGSTTASVSVANASGGTSPYTYQWYRSTTSGFTPGVGTIVSGATAQTLNDTGLTVSTTYYYVCVVTDNVAAKANSNQVTATTGAAFAAGTAFATYVAANQVQLSATQATGGSGTFTYQWFRSTSSGVQGSPVSGATSESIVDGTAAAATGYYYSLQYTDTTGGATVSTAQVHVTTLAATAEEVVGGVGDSIMAGSFSSFETPFNAMLDQLNYKLPTRQFRGVNRAISGTTSVDWSSTSGGSDLANAVIAFNSAGVTRVVLMLGTNDSKASVATPTNTYQSNIAAIIAYLKAQISTLKTIHLFSSPFQSMATGDLSVQNCGRLIAYAGALSALADGTTVFYSEPLASYNLYQNDPGLLRDGIHPTDIGDQTMGGLWGSNVATDITPGSGGGSNVRAIGFSGGFEK